MLPKPMIEIGGKPMLWHIMKIYSHYGFNDFIICCGYKQYVIKEYFANYFLYAIIGTFLCSYSTIDFLAMWEGLYNPNFNRMEFHTVRSEPGRLIMTPSQWIEKMNAIGIISKAGTAGRVQSPQR